MPANLYKRLYDLDLLRRAWHLARNDSRTDFMFDPYRYADFAFSLDDHLRAIGSAVKSGSYRPQPLRSIDVPKSSLSVRPGTVLAIEDKILLFAIACLIAPKLDRLLPETVYSWRVKKDPKKGDLFEDHEILKFPFLKRSTIEARVELIEPWYDLWPQFVKKAQHAYEKEGYRFLVVSDISSYFENIDLLVLRDLLLRHLPGQVQLVNFLFMLLSHWTWPTVHGTPSARGIPQGFGVSSFLGNVYLLPLDQAFLPAMSKGTVRYLRYMDDIKVLTKDFRAARDALFRMNEVLRSLRLNIQGAKTRILEGEEVREELYDPRFAEVDALVREIGTKHTLTAKERGDYAGKLGKHLRRVRGRRRLVKDRELRLFRRLITGFSLLQHPGVLGAVLAQLERNPDARLLASASKYFRSQPRNLSRIPRALMDLLARASSLFPYQTAQVLLTLRYVRKIPSNAWRDARRLLAARREHWYVRQQAASLLAVKELRPRELQSLRRQYLAEDNVEVKLGLIRPLVQIPGPELRELAREMVMSIEPRLQRLGRFLSGLLLDGQRGTEQATALFRQFREDVLLDRLFEIEALSKAEDPGVRLRIARDLGQIVARVRRPELAARLDAIRQRALTSGAAIVAPGGN